MSLAARLAKVEGAASRVLRCAWCRYSLVEDYQLRATGREVAREFVMRSCFFCGNQFRLPLDGMTPKERETFLLWAYTFDGETYHDERAYAAREWWMYRVYLRETVKPRPARPTPSRPTQGKPDKYALERAALKGEADELRDAALRRERRLYGPRRFPLVAALREIKGRLKVFKKYSFEPGFVSYSEDEKRARTVLIYARCMEACELVLWGAVEPETAAEIEARSAEVAGFDERSAREAREKEEERRRQERERAEQLRQDSEVRFEAPAFAHTLWTEPPRSRFRKDPAASTTRCPIIYDAEAAHVSDADVPVAGRSIPIGNFYDPNHPDAVQFMRSAPPDPTQGLTVDDIEAERERSRRGRLYYRPDDYEGDRRY